MSGVQTCDLQILNKLSRVEKSKSSMLKQNDSEVINENESVNLKKTKAVPSRNDFAKQIMEDEKKPAERKLSNHLPINIENHPEPIKVNENLPERENNEENTNPQRVSNLICDYNPKIADAWFHLIMIFGAMYFSMIVTNWGIGKGDSYSYFGLVHEELSFACKLIPYILGILIFLYTIITQKQIDNN